MDRYEESAGVGLAGILLAFVGAPAAAALSAYAYQWVQERPLSQFAHAVVPIAFGAGLGLLAAAAVLGGKVRGRGLRWAVVVVTVLSADAASFYWSWRGDAGRLDAAAADVMQPPPASAASETRRAAAIPNTYRELPFPEWLALRVELGWVAIRSVDVWEIDWRAERARIAAREPAPPPPSPVSVAPDAMLRRMKQAGEPAGTFVLVAWIGELLLLAGAALFAARFLRPPPYCTACGRWSVAKPLRRITSVDTQALRAAARTGDLEELLEPQRGERASVSGCRVLHACPSCRDSGWLDVGYAEEAAAGKSAVRHANWLVLKAVLTPEQRRILEEREASVARGREERGPRE